MTKKNSIDSLNVPEPCLEPWNKMRGTATKRFCDSCRKDVFNISGMSRRQANRLIRKSGGRICVRYARLPDGTVVTNERPLYQISRKTAGIAAGVLATTVSMSALTYAQGEPYVLDLAQVQEPAAIEQTLVPFDPLKPDEKTSQISIVVLDETGAPITGATVELTDAESKQGMINYTGPDGVASFSMLRRTRYQVYVESEGFRDHGRGIRVALDIEPDLEVVLSTRFITGVLIDDSYEIPVFELIAKNDVEGVKMAISRGFDVKTKGSYDRTALHVAVNHLRVDLVKLLVENGADINAKMKSGEAPIIQLVNDVGEEDEDVVEILRILISEGVDLDVTDEDKETLLMNAAYFDDPVVVQMLLEAGAKTDLKDEDGETAYQKIEDERIRDIFHRYGIFR